MVPFAGWDMPLHYGSQLEEHYAVRNGAGLFDVSHMAIVDLVGPNAKALLQRLLANDVGRLTTTGRALYSCMLQEQGGVLDDLIAYYVAKNYYRLVVNAAVANKDWSWIQTQATGRDVEIRRRDDLAMLALQGPNARAIILPRLPADLRDKVIALKPFHAIAHSDWFLSCSGYTGEDGFELMLPCGMAPALWRTLIADGVKPCGLGARDTLRLEAGLNLYGTDMDESKSPLECGLDWTVAWLPETRDFIGRSALIIQKKHGVLPRFVGLLSQGRGVLRNHQPVLAEGVVVGEITSGSFSPTLKQAIALARLYGKPSQVYEVALQGRYVPVQVVKLPFVRHGKVMITNQ